MVQNREVKLFNGLWYLKQRPLVGYHSHTRQFVFYWAKKRHCMNSSWSVILFFVFTVNYLLLLKWYKRVKSGFTFSDLAVPILEKKAAAAILKRAASGQHWASLGEKNTSDEWWVAARSWTWHFAANLTMFAGGRLGEERIDLSWYKPMFWIYKQIISCASQVPSFYVTSHWLWNLFSSPRVTHF